MLIARRLPLSALLIVLVVAGCSVEPRAELERPWGTESFAPASSGLTVVHLWGSWCPPCVAELPELTAFSADVPRGVTLVIVSTEEPLSESLAFLRDRGYPLETAGDPKGAFRRWMKARVVPTTILMGPDGTEMRRIEGAAPWQTQEFRAELTRLASSAETER